MKTGMGGVVVLILFLSAVVVTPFIVGGSILHDRGDGFFGAFVFLDFAS